ncbi:MAG: DUF3300 domain-containing protein [Woeseiaceae bacterium]
MKDRLIAEFGLARTAAALIALLALPVAAWAQVPVDENGEIIGNVDTLSAEAATGGEDIPLLSSVDLEELVGPIALYPDDLLAIVLPAAAYPLQIVDAARFLEALEDDPSLEPDPDWDDSVVALTNYPEVIELLNDDIDWTWRLGEAVVSQQADVVAAIETFRDRAYAAGNLKSDSYQNVSNDDGVIEITPVSEDVIYVPYYEPERVVVYQPRPAYYYYPRPYPVYYYPYSSAFAFDRGYFWGVTTAFSIGWYTNSLNVFHHSYYGHPYYGRSYYDRWWYRRPTINIYNNHYVGGNTRITVNRYNRGDRWQPRSDRREHLSDRRITRNRSYPIPRRSDAPASVSSTAAGARQARIDQTRRQQQNRENREPIAFRERPRTATVNRNARSTTSGRSDVARRAPARDTATDVRTRRDTNVAERRTGERRTEPTNRVLKQPRSEPTPKLRRPEPVAQARRGETVRSTRRSGSVVAPGRTTPAVRSARRAETPVRPQRSQPARNVVRKAPARQADVRQQQPRQQQAAPRKSAPAKESRQAPDRGTQRRRQRD